MKTLRVSIDRENSKFIFWRITGAKEYRYRAGVESLLDKLPDWVAREFKGWREFNRIEHN